MTAPTQTTPVLSVQNLQVQFPTRLGLVKAVDDVSFDLISLQYHSLKAGHDYGQYVRDARNAGRDDIADFFEQEVDDMVDGLTSLLEPIIMVVLGVLVGGMVVAMYLPIFKLGSVIH